MDYSYQQAIVVKMAIWFMTGLEYLNVDVCQLRKGCWAPLEKADSANAEVIKLLQNGALSVASGDFCIDPLVSLAG